MPGTQDFEALAALPAEAKQNLFAWCIAAVLNTQLAVGDHADPVIESAIRRLAIPFADFWRPTAANYWGRVKKAHGLAIAEGILGPRWVRDHADDKKATLAAALEKAFDPEADTACIGLDQVVLDAAGAWLPPGIAAGGNTMQGGGDDAGPDDDREPERGEFADVEAAAADLPAFRGGARCRRGERSRRREQGFGGLKVPAARSTPSGVRVSAPPCPSCQSGRSTTQNQRPMATHTNG